MFHLHPLYFPASTTTIAVDASIGKTVGLTSPRAKKGREVRAKARRAFGLRLDLLPRSRTESVIPDLVVISADYTLHPSELADTLSFWSRPPAGHYLGIAYMRQVPDCPADHQPSWARVHRRPHPASGSGRSARHLLARWHRPRPLGAVRLPAVLPDRRRVERPDPAEAASAHNRNALCSRNNPTHSACSQSFDFLSHFIGTMAETSAKPAMPARTTLPRSECPHPT